MNASTYRRGRGWRSPRRRQGLLVVAALVCLLVVTSMVAAMVQGAVRARRALHVERDRRQAELLLDAGAERAVALLATNPEYRGDTWEIKSEFILGQGDGRVTTRVARESNGNSRQLSIVAEYPLGRELAIRRSHNFQMASSPTQAQE